MVAPTVGVGLLIALVMPRSARCGVSVTLAWLLPVLGSNWSLSLTVAVLVRASALATVALSVKVALPRLARAPTSHTPVAGAYVPWLGVKPARVKPAGNRSVTCTPLAA